MIDTDHPTTATFRDVYRAAATISQKVDLRDRIIGSQMRYLTHHDVLDLTIVAFARGEYARRNHADWLEKRMLYREGMTIANLHDVSCWQGGWVHKPVPACGEDGCEDCGMVCDHCKADLP
jgi:hypothetical protein